jgi:hypothetical protein
MENGVSVTTILERDVDYRKYNYFRNINAIFIISMLLYLQLILIPLIPLSFSLFIIGNIGLLTLIIRLYRYKKKLPPSKEIANLNGFLVILIIVLSLDFLLIVTCLLAYLPSIGVTTFPTALTMIFQIVYIAKYLFVFFAVYTLFTNHRMLTKKISKKDSLLFSGFLLYPLVLLKLIFYKADVLLANYFGFKYSIVRNSLLIDIPAYHIENTASLILNLILIAITIGYAIESTIRSYSVIQEITLKSKQ